MTDRRNILPLSLPPRGLSRVEAATYIGVSISKFDELVLDRRMPPARSIDRRHVWDRVELDTYFADLPYVGEALTANVITNPAGQRENPWDSVA